VARTRTIKPCFFRHEGLASCSPSARLLFVGLLQLADKEGRLAWGADVKDHCFPYEDVDAVELAEELIAVDSIRVYAADEKVYILFTNFAKHQKVPVSEKESALPAPDTGSMATSLSEALGLPPKERPAPKKKRNPKVSLEENPKVIHEGSGGYDVIDSVIPSARRTEGCLDLRQSSLSIQLVSPVQEEQDSCLVLEDFSDLDLGVRRVWATYRKYHPRSRTTPPRSWTEIVESCLAEYSADDLCITIRWAKESRDYAYMRSKNIDKLNNILAPTKLPGRVESALEWAGITTSMDSFLEKNAQAALRYFDECGAYGRAMGPGTLIHYMAEYGLPVPSPEVEDQVITWLKKRRE
jgi:hypothetical protein|tara:strand:+ start:546 stop:1604 length:1059 start_codon:yes stop_codon:yes gene_type:complete